MRSRIPIAALSVFALMGLPGPARAITVVCYDRPSWPSGGTTERVWKTTSIPCEDWYFDYKWVFEPGANMRCFDFAMAAGPPPDVEAYATGLGPSLEGGAVIGEQIAGRPDDSLFVVHTQLDTLSAVYRESATGLVFAAELPMPSREGEWMVGATWRLGLIQIPPLESLMGLSGGLFTAGDLGVYSCNFDPDTGAFLGVTIEAVNVADLDFRLVPAPSTVAVLPVAVLLSARRRRAGAGPALTRSSLRWP